jgi:hypothetical protein
MEKKIILFITTLLLINCSSSSNTKNNSIDNTYKLELGILAGDKVDDFLNQLTQRYGFELSRNENTSNISGFYAETYLKERQPFADELSKGLGTVFNRVIVKADLVRNRTSTLSLTDLFYDIDIEIIQEGKKVNSEDILPFNFTDQGYDFTKDLAYDLKDLIQARIIQ